MDGSPHMPLEPARLALLSPLLPYPPRAGGTVHLLEATRQLARFYRVHFYALAEDPAMATWGPMADWCASTSAWQRGSAQGWTLRPPAAQHAYSPTLIEHLQRVWATTRPAIVQLEWTDMAQYAPLARRSGALVVCTAHNVGFLAQMRRARRQRGLKLRARRWLGALSLWRYERSALRQCHLIVAHGTADAALLQRWLPHVQVAYVPSGVDLSIWQPCFEATAQSQVLFVGNYLHPPNVEGAIWLARDVWPLVRQARPPAQLVLAGRDPPAEIRAFACSDIHVPGTVDDLHPLYRQASVVVAPIFWGSGIRIKLLEALACGLPVVTTALAAEGIALEDGRSALFAEHPQAFASAIVRLLDDPALSIRLGLEGRRVVERDYSWDQIGERLRTLYEEARSRL